MLRLALLSYVLLFLNIIGFSSGVEIAKYTFLQSECSSATIQFPNKITSAGALGAATPMDATKIRCLNVDLQGNHLASGTAGAFLVNGINPNAGDAADKAQRFGVKVTGAPAIGSSFAVEFWVRGMSLATVGGNSVNSKWFEFGSSSTVGSGTGGFGTTKAYEIYVFGSQIVFEFRSTGLNNLFTADISPCLSDTDDILCHVVISIEVGSRVRFFINNVQTQETFSINNPFNTEIATTDLMIGDTANPEGGEISAKGAFLQVSYFNSALDAAAVSTRFNSGPPLNNPSVINGALEHREDSESLIDVSSFVLDFDNILGTSSNPVDFILQSLPTQGFLSNNVTGSNNAIAVGALINSNTVYTQRTEDLFGITDSFTFKARDVDTKESGLSTVTLKFIGTNDAPEGTTPDLQKIQEFLTREITVQLFDKDGVTTDPSSIIAAHLAAGIRVETISLDEEGLGSFSKCGSITPLVPDDVINKNLLSDDSGKATACIQFNAATSTSGSAGSNVLGSAELTYVVIDGANKESGPITLNVDVITGLVAGCGAQGMNPDLCVSQMDENFDGSESSIEITLQSLDTRCEEVVNGAVQAKGDADPLVCPRLKTIAIQNPLPDPVTQGFLTAVENGVDVTIDQSKLIGGVYEIKNNQNTVKFHPVKGYFNVARFPVCVDNNNDPRSSCLAEVAAAAILCVGPLSVCKNRNIQTSEVQFTAVPHNKVNANIDMLPLGVNTDGECCTEFDGESKCEIVEGGCPIKIHHLLKIGGFSEETNATHTVWVKNELDLENTNVISFPDKFDGIRLKSGKTLNDPKPLELTRIDQDAKNMEVVFNFGAGIALSLVSTQRAKLLEMRNAFFEMSTCFRNGNCADDQNANVRGIQSSVNQFLASLVLDLLQAFDGTEVALNLVVQNRFKNGVTNALSFEIVSPIVDLNEDKGNFLTDYPELSAAIGAAGVLILCCVCRICLTGKRAACSGFRGGLNARRRLNRAGVVKKERIDYEDDEKQATIWNYICPCICPMDEEVVERRRREQENLNADADLRAKYGQKNVADYIPIALPASKRNKGTTSGKDASNSAIKSQRAAKSEGVVQSRRNIRAEEPKGKAAQSDNDIMNWEKHIEVVDGKEVPFYYNSVTDESQWHSPYPGKPIKRGRKVEEAQQKRFSAKPPPPRETTKSSKKANVVKSARGPVQSKRGQL